MLLRSAGQPLLQPLTPASAVGRPLRTFFARKKSSLRSAGSQRQLHRTKFAVRDQSSSKSSTTLDKTLAVTLVPLLPALYAFPALADSSSYSPGAGADVVKNIAGTAYAGLLAFWLFKVIGRRVKRGQNERLARERNEEPEVEDDAADEKEVTASAAAFGALQAGFFTYLLFLLSNSISYYFTSQELPDQFTAKNITVTIRTAVGGLAYLATFIFGANTLGLAGLALKLAISPDKQDKATNPPKK